MNNKIIYGFIAFFAVFALLLILVTPTTPLFASGVVEINDLFETGTGRNTGYDPGGDIQPQARCLEDIAGPEPQDDPGEDGDGTAPPDSTGGDTGGY